MIIASVLGIGVSASEIMVPEFLRVPIHMLGPGVDPFVAVFSRRSHAVN